MPQMNARPTSDFQRPPFPQQAPQKPDSEAMMGNMLMVQQKQNEYIKQLASKVYLLTTHEKMLKA